MEGFSEKLEQLIDEYRGTVPQKELIKVLEDAVRDLQDEGEENDTDGA